MTELAFVSARELAYRIRRKQLSSVEVTQYFLRRIEEKNAALNAVVTLDAGNALAAAGRADRALAAGESVGPLHGVPMTIKDAFQIQGVRTTVGAKVWHDFIAPRDAVAVARLRAAGAIFLGKTNTPAFCSDLQSYNPIFGTSNNPWDVTRTPGGSSGGAAAALAGGLTPIELGSDLAGSIRAPASFCGVFGHKPSYGLVPTRGHMPGPPEGLYAVDMNVAGPMARDADDLAWLLDVIAGPLPDQAKAYRLQLPAARAQSLRGYRVGVWLDDPACSVDDSVLSCLNQAAAALSSAGANLTQEQPAFELGNAAKIYRALLDPMTTVGLPNKILAPLEALAAGQDEADPRTQYARNGLIRHRDWIVWQEFREQLRATWARYFEDYDVLLCPVVMSPAIEHDHSEPQALRKISVNGVARNYTDLFIWSSLASCAYLPATVIPAGRTAQGLPVGLQIIGPYLEDRTTIDFAGRASEVLGGFVAPPGY